MVQFMSMQYIQRNIFNAIYSRQYIRNNTKQYIHRHTSATHTNHPPDNHHDNYSTVAPHVPREMNPSHPRDRNALHALEACVGISPFAPENHKSSLWDPFQSPNSRNSSLMQEIGLLYCSSMGVSQPITSQTTSSPRQPIAPLSPIKTSSAPKSPPLPSPQPLHSSPPPLTPRTHPAPSAASSKARSHFHPHSPPHPHSHSPCPRPSPASSSAP